MLRLAMRSCLLAVGLLAMYGGNVQGQDVVEVAKAAVADGTGIVETIANAFQGGKEGAKAQQDLIEYCGDATFVLFVLFISYIIASGTGRYLGQLVTAKVDVTLGKFLAKAVRNLIMLVVAMVTLERVCDVNVAGFAAILAAAGFAIGMALQGTLGNFAAGVMLLIFRPFKVDDYIVVSNGEGTVEEIDLFTTRLNAPDNRHLIIPNGEIFGTKLENYSRNPLRRVEVNVGAAYNANLDATRKTLELAATKIGMTYTKNPNEKNAPQVYLKDLGNSSVNWQLRVWCHPKEYWKVREELTAAAKIAMDHAGISIPFPQMDVHVVGKVMAKAA